MAEIKTKPTDDSVMAFLDTVEGEHRRQEGLMILDLMREITGVEPKMWGSSIVGFGEYHYVYASGREGDWFLTGFSPRKQNLTLYAQGGFAHHGALLEKLGKHKMGKGCLYIKKLEDIDLPTLRTLIASLLPSHPAAEEEPGHHIEADAKSEEPR
ncbi:MAG: DUF1801 domain-containing protein [Ardenticatenales bacterium]|nr:DUF1801 domain-containing protein [Ardenticatenales bacterium]